MIQESEQNVSIERAEYLRNQVNEARHAGDIEAETEAAFDLAAYRIESQEWRFVESLLEEFIGMNRVDRDRYMGGELILAVSGPLISAGNPQLAAQMLYQAAKIGDELRMPQLEFSARFQLGTALMTYGEFRDAIANFEAAMVMLGDDDLSDAYRGEISMLMGDCYLAMNRVESARLAFNRVLSIATQQDDQPARGLTFGKLGHVANNTSNWEQAQAYYEQSASILRGEEDRRYFLGIVLANLSDVYTRVGRPEDARRVLVEARELFYKEDANDLAAEADAEIKRMDGKRSAF